MEHISFKGKDSKNKKIEFNKLNGGMLKKARSAVRHEFCMLCGKKVEGFCNSHCIPQVCLKNIDTDGKVGSVFSIIDNDIINNDKGVGNAGVFHNICHDCDNTAFQTYENPQSYYSNIRNNNELLNQIALKNILRDIYKHEIELEYIKMMPSELYKKNGNHSAKMFAELLSRPIVSARRIDIEECKNELKKCKDSILTGNPWLRIVTCEQLDYCAPVAYQGMIALNTGFNSEVINDKYSYEMGYHIEYMHLAILPFEKRSIILLFLNKDNKRYDMFIKKMGQLSKTKQIQVINHILFLYCEDYFISKKISTKTLNKIKLLASAIEGPVSMNPTESLKQVISDYDLNNAWSQKNILGIHC